MRKRFNHKLLVFGTCILIIAIGAGTVYGRSRSHSRKFNTGTPFVTPTVTLTPTKAEDNENLLSGQWQYMPGMTKDGLGFVIHPTKISIVEQDGIVSTPNPPINLFGTHLENITGDFEINSTVQLNTSKAAFIQLYGKTPIIADEFRVERQSVRLKIQSGKLTVSLWNGSGQEPVLEQTYSFVPDSSINLNIARKGKKLFFTINNIQAGSIPDNGIFQSGQLWFGLDSDGGDWIFAGLNAQKLNGGSYDIKDASTFVNAVHDLQGLQVLASKKRPDFIVGMAMAPGPIASDPEYEKIALDSNMFGSMTPENQMKMINLQPQRGVYTFELADGLVKMAKQNGIKMHGHTLVFGEANPPWFNALPVQTNEDKGVIRQVMIDHITKVVKHFGNDINSWDVINEPIADYDDFDADSGRIYRNHKWFQAMGENYIITALKTAYQANPNAILFINEYGLEEDGERWDTFINMLNKLKNELQIQGIPTDRIGVGFQAHVYESADIINASVLRRHIEQLEKIGFKTQISEMDVYSDDGNAIQAQQYSDIFSACLDEKNCIAWRGWILSDRYDLFVDDDGSIQYGTDGLFGSNMLPRPGLKAIQQVLK